MPEFGRLLLAAVTGAVLVVAAQWWLQGPAMAGHASQSHISADTTGSPEQQENSLGARLNELQSSQQRLQAEVAELRTRLAEGAVPSVSVASADVVTLAQPTPQTQPAGAARILQRLTATGVGEDEAEALVQRLDELALARLQADYQVQQATGDKEQHRAAREARRLIPRDDKTIREEFGDTAFDSYLYASGQPNRVEVASVLRSSAAVDAGVQSGDVLRSLDGQPLYSVRDLTARVREGSPDQTYALSIERDGQTLEVWVPGGPLGVRVSGKSAPPNN